MALSSKSFGTQHSKKPHLTYGPGGIGGEVNDLRNDVEAAFLTSDGKTAFPTIDWVDGAPPKAAGGTAVIKGSGFIQGQTFDSVVLTAADGGKLTLHALKPGVSGLAAVVITPASTLAVTYSAGLLTIRPQATIGDTAAAIATAINADDSQCVGIIRAVVTTGGTFAAALAQASFTGGLGTYASNLVYIAGISCKPLHTTGTNAPATWTDTILSVDVTALTGTAAGDTVNCYVLSNGIKSNSISLVVSAP